MPAADTATTALKDFTACGSDALPDPPTFRVGRRATVFGPGTRCARRPARVGRGLVMVGANIGGGEWLFGPVVTAQYGGTVMWIATVAILVQVAYNLSVTPHKLGGRGPGTARLHPVRGAVRAVVRRADRGRLFSHAAGTAVLDDFLYRDGPGK